MPTCKYPTAWYDMYLHCMYVSTHPSNRTNAWLYDACKLPSMPITAENI